MNNNSINIRNLSFACFDDAMSMCRILAQETGNQYTVMPDNHLGFTAVKQQEPNKNIQENTIGTINENYRQSFRGFIGHYLEIGAGLALFNAPDVILAWVVSWSWVGVHHLQLPDIAGLAEIIRWSGGLLALYGSRFIYSYYAVKLFFDSDGIILRKGIVALDQVQIRYRDIKTISVHQHILNRLLGIGTLHLDSAGTNGNVDIAFDNIKDPVFLRRHIQQIIDRYTQ